MIPYDKVAEQLLFGWLLQVYLQINKTRQLLFIKMLRVVLNNIDVFLAEAVNSITY